MSILDSLKGLEVEANIDIISPSGPIRVTDIDEQIIHVHFSNKESLRDALKAFPIIKFLRTQKIKDWRAGIEKVGVGLVVQVGEKVWVNLQPGKASNVKVLKLFWQQMLTWFGR